MSIRLLHNGGGNNVDKYKSNNPQYTTFIVRTNQWNIIDGTLNQGSFTPKYIKGKEMYYSEHAGYINVCKKRVSSITFEGNTNVVSSNDNLFMPSESLTPPRKSYIFHTHPLTPTYGGRRNDGIIYECPSTFDIIQFMRYRIENHIIGSIVVGGEGVYIIRKKDPYKKFKAYDGHSFTKSFRKAHDLFQDIHSHKLGKEGYLKYALDNEKTFVSPLNDVLVKFNIIIDFYARTKINNVWLLPDIKLRVSNVSCFTQ